MRHTDIAIAGGGLAGSTAAAMLGRAGADVVLIDPREVYPPDFRCEKLDELQVGLLEKTGLAGAVLRAATCDEEVWIARFGRLVENGPIVSTTCSTIRSSTPFAPKSRRAFRSFTARLPPLSAAPTGKRSRYRAARRFPRVWSCWRTD